MGQPGQVGFLALQISRPKYINCREKLSHPFFGICSMELNSIFTGSLLSVRSSRWEILDTCVSTTIPGILKAAPRTTLAVLRPTPGSLTSSVEGCQAPLLVFFHEHFSTILYVTGFVAKKTRGTDEVFNGRQWCFLEIHWRGEFCKQPDGYMIDSACRCTGPTIW